MGQKWPFFNIGEVYMLEGNYPKALVYTDSALKINEATGDKTGLGWCYNNIGKIYFKQKKYDEAEKYCLYGLVTGREMNDINGAANANKSLGEIYQARGNYGKALAYYQDYIKDRDSIFNNDNSLKIAALQAQRETALKERQIEINRRTLTQNENQRNLFIAGLALLALTIAAVYKNYKTQKKINKVQGELLLQKETLMKEIHHRVKNNLQVVATLLDLQLSGTSDMDARQAITESTTRIKAISLLHQQLYQHENVSSIECAQFINDLYSQVNTVFGKEHLTVTLQNQVPETILDVDTAVPLGLIINELLTNSYKYAFAGGNGTITIKLYKIPDCYTLTYTDSGPGWNGSADIKKIKSLGMLLMTSLCRQIGGTFGYDRATKMFKVTFKDMIMMKVTA
jgi:two-component sensor histidine kinase